jgi:hypothetical protein
MREYTTADVVRTAMSVLMIVMGSVILVRTLPLGFHAQALLVALGFIGLGAYRLSFVVAYMRRRRISPGGDPRPPAEGPGTGGRRRVSASPHVAVVDDAAPESRRTALR